MARVVLREDTRDDPGVVVVLSNACPTDSVNPSGVEFGQVEVWPRLEFRLRVRTGFDDDGNPQFAWSVIAAEHSILWEQREEWDAEAGVTLVKATATVSNDSGADSVPETAIVVQPDEGVWWRVTASKVYADRIEVSLERVEAQKTQPGVPDEPLIVQGVITGHGPPPPDLEAAVGTRYIDLDTGIVYEAGV